ncbi:MAG TPA: M28 family peptidase [Gemmatimonadales bacterium]|nr:M28 family peptidase [Gemmatimonadales bacterium]
MTPALLVLTLALQGGDSLERRLLAIPDTASVRTMSRDLTRVPHVAGTPEQAAARDYVLGLTRRWGLETWAKSYDVYLPHPDTVGAWLILRAGGRAEPLDLREPPVEADPVTSGPQVPPFNGYAGDGDVTGEVVYVGYGLIEDYRRLDSLGVDVRGRIALARYGRSFRGIKAREAERHGAVGLIMYSDPEDDGYYRGDVYPAGPMRPPGGIQRGSVMNGTGDPTTPGYASLPGARRVPEDSLPIPRIPVVPMGYGNARRILESLGGPSVPQEWQGALPFRYHVGPGPVRVRLKVENQRGPRALRRIFDTFAAVRGERWPEQWIVLGAHLDAWTPGAEDNVSGSVAVLEAARAFAELARQGVRPARTVIFATWDAEEWGLIGSTEWVEELADSLRAHAVAYLNADGVVSGPDFGGAASPSLKRLFREVARQVPDPSGRGSVYQVWLARQRGDTAGLRLGNLGGGSDFQGFYHHLGIPAGGMGFDGPAGIYHSMYDSYHWMSTFGDPEYRRHRAVAQLVALAAWRLANEPVAPLDYAGWGREMRALVAQLDSGIARQGWSVSTQGLKDALARFTRTADEFDRARAQAGDPGPERAARATGALMQVERRVTRPEGLRSRPWYKSLQFASDLDRGYQTMAFPSVNEAIRYGDEETARRELEDLVRRIEHARQALEEAAAALR